MSPEGKQFLPDSDTPVTYPLKEIFQKIHSNRMDTGNQGQDKEYDHGDLRRNGPGGIENDVRERV